MEICDQLQRAREAGLAIERGSIVSAYWPMRDELDTRKLLGTLHGDGMQCALPVMQRKDKPLSFRRWRPVMYLKRLRLASPSRHLISRFDPGDHVGAAFGC